jgi:hypothetical protein
MRRVEAPQDRNWIEWVQLLKQLTIKRHIPARVLYNGQLRHFVQTLESSLDERPMIRGESVTLMDDRSVLKTISVGIQVAKIMRNVLAMSK